LNTARAKQVVLQPRAGRLSLVLRAEKKDVPPLFVPPVVAAPPAPLPEAGWSDLPNEEGLVFTTRDGKSTAVFARYDSVELLVGSKQVVGVSIDSRVAFRLARFLIWYWAIKCWFGWREKLWRWRDARRKAIAARLAR